MNIVIAIMLVFSCIGFIDRMIGGKLGLAPDFEKGLEMMGSLAVSLIGVLCIGVFLAEQNADFFAGLSAVLPFDPSVIIGSLLAPDMGGLPISLEIAESRSIAIFSGVLLSTVIGVTICFQLPICMSAIKDKQDINILMKGFVVGLIASPVGVVVGGLMLGISPIKIIINYIPVIILVAVLTAGILISSRITSAILTVFGNAVKIISMIMFGMVMAGVFIPKLALADLDMVMDSFLVVGKMTCVICGSFVFSQLALKYFKRPFTKTAEILGINEYAVIGLLLNVTTTFGMLPIYGKMDRKGQLINGAFCVGGAYILGGQMAFVTGMTTGIETVVFFVSKALYGICGALLALLLSSKIKGLTEPEVKDSVPVATV